MKNTIPEVDAYIERSADFARPILRHLRDLFHRACPDIRESIKWSSPFFEYRGIVGNMSAFQGHVSYGFWKAGLMSDPEGILETAGNTQMAVLKATGLADLPTDDVLVAYIREAVELNEKGIKVPRPARRDPGKLEVPGDLQSALAESRQARENFEAFSYSQRKEYVDWITEAKRQSTRDRRLSTAMEWLAEGKPRNWKYMKEWR